MKVVHKPLKYIEKCFLKLKAYFELINYREKSIKSPYIKPVTKLLKILLIYIASHREMIYNTHRNVLL